MKKNHIPVLKREVLKYLNPKPNENFIDCTVGLGGHTLAILGKNKPKGRVLGIEIDQELYKKLKKKFLKFGKRLILINDSYSNLKKIIQIKKFQPVAGILFDLGLSSWHLENSGRGFSFLKNEPLDMRYDKNEELTAEKIVNEWSEDAIERVLRKYGEERFAKRIAKEIVNKRKKELIKTTLQLVGIIEKATPAWYHHRKIHFATKTFQALRIVVNDELNNLKKALPQALDVLEERGRLVIISFHSLEDRISKNFFKESAKKNFLKILTKKPIRPRKQEIIQNPRSRSAKLRAGIKI